MNHIAHAMGNAQAQHEGASVNGVGTTCPHGIGRRALVAGTSGTVAYTSPEQVCAKVLDSRTDLSSFGEGILNRVPVSPIRLNPDRDHHSGHRDHPGMIGIPESLIDIARNK
jgi:hypothetical protein